MVERQHSQQQSEHCPGCPGCASGQVPVPLLERAVLRAFGGAEFYFSAQHPLVLQLVRFRRCHQMPGLH